MVACLFLLTSQEHEMASQQEIGNFALYSKRKRKVFLKVKIVNILGILVRLTKAFVNGVTNVKKPAAFHIV